jgi:hypothetical protein
MSLMRVMVITFFFLGLRADFYFFGGGLPPTDILTD